MLKVEMLHKILKNIHRNMRTFFCSFSISVFFLFTLCSFNFGHTNQFADSQSLVPIRWKSNKIKIALSNSLVGQNPNSKNNNEFLNAVKRSLQSWEAIANIEFIEMNSDKLSTNFEGKIGDGINLITISPTAENLALFNDNPFETSSKTRVFYNRKGIISEADIVLNPLVQFTTDGTFGTFDLESTITHEIGHLLGLDHSPVIGSIMQTHQGKNGIYSLLKNNRKSLTDDDINGIRSLYGAKSEDSFGNLTGKIYTKGVSQELQVWLENSLDGNIISGFFTRLDGTFKINNITSGKYKIYTTDRNQLNFSQYLGEVLVKQNSTNNFVKSVKLTPKTFSVEYVGTNAQLSNISVETPIGSSNLIFIGGNNLDEKDITVNFSSPHLSVKQDSLISHDFGDKTTVISFELVVSENAVVGDYSINVSNLGKETANLLGGIKVF